MGSCFGRCFSNVTDPFTFRLNILFAYKTIYRLFTYIFFPYRYFRHTGSHTHEEEQVELDPCMSQEYDRSSSKKKDMEEYQCLWNLLKILGRKNQINTKDLNHEIMRQLDPI
ncbi:Protein of unknown function [Cotesia congregata]|uniref:Uncharacterized protein n=1 Tax=Cotesia congregata TaxID=51543 RepID=A0A8J2HMT1_COTCN|nr:Protein of unknown function [Cotesia congregata]